MFARISSVFFYIVSILVLAGVAFGAPADVQVRDIEARDTINQCNTGPMQCCDSTFISSSSTVTSLFGMLNLPLPGVNSLVGMSCSPTTSFGIGSGAHCTQQPVCCTDNHFNGLVNIGCSPITINM